MRKPSRWWYVVSAVVAFGGCGGAIANGVVTMIDSVESMERAVVPGTASLELEPGSYTAYYEARSTVDGEHFSTGDSVSGLRCTLVSPDGEPVALASASAHSTYTLGGHSGASLFEFDVARAGVHELTCDYDADGKRIVLAFGDGVLGPILWTIVPALLFGFGGVAIFVIVLLKRRRRPIQAVPAASMK